MRKYAWIIMISFFACLFTGCGSEKKTDDLSQNMGREESRDANFIYTEESDKKLYILEGIYAATEISEGGLVIGEPKMNYGQAACIIADVEIELSKSDEEVKRITIQELKSFQPMKMSEIAEIIEPVEAKKGVSYKEHFLTYTDGEDIYYIVRNWPYVNTFKGDSTFMSYSYFPDSFHTNPLEAFWIRLSLGDTDNRTIATNYTEDEILNLSDAEIFFLGIMESEGRLKSVSKSVYGEEMVLEEGYMYIGFAAEKPAGNVDEAQKIAAAEWAKQTQYDYYDVYLIGETDEYWMFERNLGTVVGKEKQYMVVYKKDYYETKDSWPPFELNEDFVRNYMAYTYAERFTDIYIGEYIIPDGDDLIFRRYSVEGDVLEGEYVYQATLGCDEWRFFSDGTVEFAGYVHPDREAQSNFDDIR